MKQHLFNRSINYLFLLIFCAACNKSVDQPSNIGVLRTRPATDRTVSVVVDNWVQVDQGKYISDLYAAVKKQAYTFSNITNITVNTGQKEIPLLPGTPLGINGGELTVSGTTLYYNAFSYYGQYGPPISSLSLNVTIN
jgi:hypothetical protein